jgi:mannose-6-phosphate isomerase-like protein (cupin superfamily)
MHKSMTAPAALLLLLSTAGLTAQTPTTPKQPRGAATDVSHDTFQATVKKMTAAVSDIQLRVVGIENQPNIGIGVVRRTKPGGANSIEHSQITEIYYVTEGAATLVTGGTMENPREAAADSQVVTVLNGPSTNGGKIAGGVSRTVGVGDVVVIPPNTPHWFSEITSGQIVYLVVRVDPNKVLPAGYVAK